MPDTGGDILVEPQSFEMWIRSSVARRWPRFVTHQFNKLLGDVLS